MMRLGRHAQAPRSLIIVLVAAAGVAACAETPPVPGGAAGMGGIGGGGGTPGTAGVEGWAEPMLVGAGSSLFDPQVVVDSDGNATAVWWDVVRFDVWSNRYTSGGDWGTPAVIGTDSIQPRIAAAPDGHVTAVWAERTGMYSAIASRRYTPNEGWGARVLIDEVEIGDATDPQVAVDASGHAIAVWAQNDGVRDNVWSNRYTADEGWGTAELIESGSDGWAYKPRVAVGPSGDAVAAWSQSDGISPSIWANQFALASGWGTAAPIETSDGTAWLPPELAIDPAGNAIAVWQQSDAAFWSVWSNRYTPGGGWGTAVLLETDDLRDMVDPQVAVDTDGNAAAVWVETDGPENQNVWSARYTPSGGWATPVLIQGDSQGRALTPQIAFGPGGVATAVWEQVGRSQRNIWANRYTPSQGWGTALIIGADGGSVSETPDVAVDGNGHATAVWKHRDSLTEEIRANRFEQ